LHPFSRFRFFEHRSVVVAKGILVGAAPHAATAALFLLMWVAQRADAPTCFPDEDGVSGSLDCSLAICVMLSLVLAIYNGRRIAESSRPFLLGLAVGWGAGFVLVVVASVDVLAFVSTLGSGCGGSPRTPWSS
jgi:hypothetical protein